jgi:two-component system NtrC family sensor kinase
LEAALHENEKITRDLQTAKDRLEQENAERERINKALAHEKEEQRALIQKLEEAHDQLFQSDKLASIGQLAAGVAHEVNNPIGFVNSNLSVLKGYAESLFGLLDGYDALVLQRESLPDMAARIDEMKKEADLKFLREDMVALIDESIDGTQRVRRIVQDLRDFSRVGEAALEMMDIQRGLESTLNVVKNEIRYKADVVQNYAKLPLVECRPSQINQVFLNLLVNAAQAIPQHGTITVATRRETQPDGDWAVVSISDTGIGIPAEIKDKIFDPFFTTKPVGKGTGLGLSVSYGIIEKHGGRIVVDSETGVGTTFHIWLPIRTSPGNSSTGKIDELPQ